MTGNSSVLRFNSIDKPPRNDLKSAANSETDFCCSLVDHDHGTFDHLKTHYRKGAACSGPYAKPKRSDINDVSGRQNVRAGTFNDANLSRTSNRQLQSSVEALLSCTRKRGGSVDEGHSGRMTGVEGHKLSCGPSAEVGSKYSTDPSKNGHNLRATQCR